MGLKFGFRWHNAALACFALAALLTIFSRTFADPDLWGHVRFGQDILETHRVIQVDKYSYTSGDQAWINHEWLAEVIFALLFNAFGARGLVGLSLLVFITIVGLIYRYLRTCRLSALQSWILIMLISFLIRAGMEWIRPQLFTYVCFAALMRIIMKTKQDRNRWLWLLVPIFALWPNLHGGFLAGVGILLLWLIIFLTGPIFSKSISPHGSNQLWTGIIVVPIALLATLLTPYGLTLWSFLLKTATVPRPDIIEWQPLSLISLVGGCYLLLLFISLTAFILSKQKRVPFEILAFVICAILPLVALRHLPLFAIALPFLSGKHLADVWNRLSHSQSSLPTEHDHPSFFRRGFTLILLTAVLIFLAAAWHRSQHIQVDKTFYPINAVNILKTIKAEGAMAVHFDWGEYVIWHLGPAVKVSVDGRRETVYSPERYEKAMNFVFGIGDWKAVLQSEEVTMALVKNQSSTFNLMSERMDWVPVYSDSVSALFLKRASTLHQMMEQSAPLRPSHEKDTFIFP